MRIFSQLLKNGQINTCELLQLSQKNSFYPLMILLPVDEINNFLFQSETIDPQLEIQYLVPSSNIFKEKKMEKIIESQTQLILKLQDQLNNKVLSKEEFKTFQTAINQKLDPVPDQITVINQQLNSVPDQITAINQKLNPIPDQITVINQKLDPIPDQITVINQKLDPVPDQITAMIKNLHPYSRGFQKLYYNNQKLVLCDNPIELRAPTSGLASILFTKEGIYGHIVVSINDIIVEVHNPPPQSTYGIFPVFVKIGDVIKITGDKSFKFYIISIDIQEIVWE